MKVNITNYIKFILYSLAVELSIFLLSLLFISNFENPLNIIVYTLVYVSPFLIVANVAYTFIFVFALRMLLRLNKISKVQFMVFLTFIFFLMLTFAIYFFGGISSEISIENTINTVLFDRSFVVYYFFFIIHSLCLITQFGNTKLI